MKKGGKHQGQRGRGGGGKRKGRRGCWFRGGGVGHF